MIVFGVIGNLYIEQKTNRELHFNYSSKEKKDELKETLKKAKIIAAIEYAEKKYPNITPKKRVEKITSNPDEKRKAHIAIMNEYFIRICEDDKLNFNYYPKGFNNNGG
jgi:hypothetical protein